MKRVDTLIHARWIIPVEPLNLVLENHSIAVGEGRIIDIVPTAKARSTFEAEAEIDLPQHALIPGFRGNVGTRATFCF